MTAYTWLLLIRLCTPHTCDTLAIQGPYYSQQECEAEILRVDRPMIGLCERRG